MQVSESNRKIFYHYMVKIGFDEIFWYFIFLL